MQCKYYSFILVFGKYKEKLEFIFNDVNLFNYWCNGLTIYANNNSKSELFKYERLNSFHPNLNTTPSIIISRFYHNTLRNKKSKLDTSSFLKDFSSI